MKSENKVVGVIQAGGKGTRISALTGDEMPKAMLPLNGKPLVQRQLEEMVRNGIAEVAIITGHLGEKIQAFLGDGSRFAVKIQYITEKSLVGTGGSLHLLKQMYPGADFFLTYGDILFMLDFARFLSFHKEKCALVSLLVHPNSHPYDSDIVLVDSENRVLEMNTDKTKRAEWADNLINSGIFLLSQEFVDALEDYGKCSLETDLIVPAIKSGRVFGYRSPEYVKDVGTPERFAQAEADEASGLCQSKCLKNRQRCIFFDRDGTINVYRGLVSTQEQFELEEHAAEAIKLVNNAGFLAIVVTNQPVVARGLCSIDEVYDIHRKMQTLLGRRGAYLDDIVFCPHHPDGGYPGENQQFKVSCTCRKPAVGMIRRMEEKYNIDSALSYIMGDSTRDIQTGKNAGLKTILVQTGEAGRDGQYLANPDYIAGDILEAVKLILKKESLQ